MRELDQMLVSYQQIWLDSLIKCWCLTSKDGLRERELDTGPLKRVLKHFYVEQDWGQKIVSPVTDRRQIINFSVISIDVLPSRMQTIFSKGEKVGSYLLCLNHDNY